MRRPAYDSSQSVSQRDGLGCCTYQHFGYALARPLPMTYEYLRSWIRVQLSRKFRDYANHGVLRSASKIDASAYDRPAGRIEAEIQPCGCLIHHHDMWGLRGILSGKPAPGKEPDSRGRWKVWCHRN